MGHLLDKAREGHVTGWAIEGPLRPSVLVEVSLINLSDKGASFLTETVSSARRQRAEEEKRKRQEGSVELNDLITGLKCSRAHSAMSEWILSFMMTHQQQIFGMEKSVATTQPALTVNSANPADRKSTL